MSKVISPRRPLQRDPSPADRDAEAFQMAQLHYSYGLAQAEIARELDVSPAKVSRHLEYARQQGWVQFLLVPPLQTMLSQRLERLLQPWGIRQVLVADGHGRELVGHAAAHHFDAHAPSKVTLVLDGGLTVRDFVTALPKQMERFVRIVPIAADPVSYRVSCYELMTLLATKCVRHELQKPPHLTNIARSKALTAKHSQVVRAACAADFVVLGLGPWRRKYTALEFVQDLGLDPETLRKKYRKVKAMCGYLPLTESGETIRIQELERFMPHSMPSAALRALARDPGKHVLALAASAEKLEALCLALHARLCNTIVIDEPLAIAMLEGLSAESVSSEDAHRSIPGNSTKPAQ